MGNMREGIGGELSTSWVSFESVLLFLMRKKQIHTDKCYYDERDLT